MIGEAQRKKKPVLGTCRDIKLGTDSGTQSLLGITSRARRRKRGKVISDRCTQSLPTGLEMSQDN